MTKGKRDPIDAYVGQRVKVFRLKKTWSQTDLAGALDLTFQQVQKYEKGTNRIGSGRLLRIAALLGQPITEFFPKENGAGNEQEVAVMALVDSRSAMRLLQAFRAIENEMVRSQLVGLAVAISERGGHRP